MSFRSALARPPADPRPPDRLQPSDRRRDHRAVRAHRERQRHHRRIRFLLGIFAIAASWGWWNPPRSVAAMLCFNFYFLPPIGQFTIADPQNWVALFAFLATALVASHISDREKRQAREARSRQTQTEQLYALSRFILLTNPTQSVGRQARNTLPRSSIVRLSPCTTPRAAKSFAADRKTSPASKTG